MSSAIEDQNPKAARPTDRARSADAAQYRANPINKPAASSLAADLIYAENRRLLRVGCAACTATGQRCQNYRAAETERWTDAAGQRQETRHVILALDLDRTCGVEQSAGNR